jgi:hypothetical protein
VGGPKLSFFKNKDKIRIVWDTEDVLDNGIYIWTAKNGNFEMNFADFIDAIDNFGLKFFKAMDRQIELTIEKNWDSIKVDKSRLIEEHKERKEDFYFKLSLLKQNSYQKTNWAEIQHLYDRMINEIRIKSKINNR